MAAKKFRGNILLELLVVLMGLLLIAVLIVPNKIWEEENQITDESRNNLNAIYEAERFFYKSHDSYTDTLNKLLDFVRADSGLADRQSLVSLTRSFTQVLDNYMSISTVKDLSEISQAAYEVSGDLLGNRRYFRKHENLVEQSIDINRDLIQFDSSLTFPQFCRAKLFVDSLRNLRERISDYPLQNGILNAMHYVDSVNAYLGTIETEKMAEYWNAEYQKILGFIKAIQKTDISTVSSVADRLKKFIDRINTSVKDLENGTHTNDLSIAQSEAQNLANLHERFIAPEFFILTKRYGLTALNETDSILINLSENNFSCPDSKQPYLIDTTYHGQLTVESPNLLDQFSQKFREDIAPVKNMPFMEGVKNLDTVLAAAKQRLDENRKYLRRNTDILLSLKELSVELDAMGNVFFHRYTHQYNDFVNLIETENKLSKLKPAIEDVLNPMDTLATRMVENNIVDLEEKIKYFDSKLKRLDSLTQAARLSRRTRKNVKSNAEVFQPAFEILSQIKSGFDPAKAQELREAGKNLEEDLLAALEGQNETVYVIFRKKHINHGYIRQGEKSWEQK